MSDQIFLLSDQNGALVRHASFQGKKKLFAALKLAPWNLTNALSGKLGFELSFVNVTVVGYEINIHISRSFLVCSSLEIPA